MTASPMPEPAGPWQPGMPLSRMDLGAVLGPVRDVEHISVARTGSLVETSKRSAPYVVRIRADWDVLFDHYLAGVASSRAPFTVRKYGYGCLVLARYAIAFDVDLALWSRTEAKDMVRHLRIVDNPQRRRGTHSDTPAPGTLVVLTMKRYLSEGYSPGYINGLLIAGHGFFEWFSENGGPIRNPIPHGAGQGPGQASVNAHHNPQDEYKRPSRRAQLRQQVPEWLPRRIQTAHLDILRNDLRTARDEAMFTILEQTAIRATELATLSDRNLDPLTHTAAVLGKGLKGSTRQVPFSPNAFALIDKARQELLSRRRVRIATDQPLFWTLGRREPKPMDYTSLRSWWRALNERHGFNYTLHDMRHTAAFRMVDSGHLNLVQVQEILGHRHLSTTQLYTRPTTSEIVAAASAWWADADRVAAIGLNFDAVQHLNAQDLAEVFEGLL